jgi:hypothetical protein
MQWSSAQCVKIVFTIRLQGTVRDQIGLFAEEIDISRGKRCPATSAFAYAIDKKLISVE